MKFNCNKCDTEMVLGEDIHTCPSCDNTLTLDEASNLFEEGEIVGIATSEDLDEKFNFEKKKKKGKDADGNDDKSPKGEKEGDDKDMDENFDINAIEIDVQEDINAIFNGQDFSADFVKKATSIFETAIKTQVKTHLEAIKEDISAAYDKKLVVETAKLESDVDSYLDVIVTEWKDENKIAVEQGLRTEMTENFIAGIKRVFEENYVEIPEGRYDLVDNLSTQVESVRAELDAALNENIKLKADVVESVSASIQANISEGLAATEVEKFEKLAENVKFKDEEQYSSELNELRESYFKSKAVVTNSLNEDFVQGVNDGNTQTKENAAISSAVRILNRT